MNLDDVDLKQLRLLADFARELGVHDNSLRLYAKHGRKNWATGKKVRLRVIRTPTGMKTSWQLYQKFLEELNEEPGPHE